MKRIMAGILALVLAGCADRSPTPADWLGASPAPNVLTNLPPQVRKFIERKAEQIPVLAAKLGVAPDRATLDYFAFAQKGQYRAVSKIYQDLRERGGKIESTKYDPDLRLPLWDLLLEVQLVLDAYAAGAGKFATSIGEGIAQSIPPGSIYFGGTDTGRGLAAAFCPSLPDGASFFVLTQNQLADGQHLAYLRAAFGDKIHVLSGEDSQRAFQDYLDDVSRRHKHDHSFPNELPQLRPSEKVSIVDGRIQVNGQYPVMAINGLLAKMIFDRNPSREFFVEESFPLDWTYPYLEPHGFIMKINRQPLAELSADVISKNRDFWKQRQTEFIGDWLRSDTPVREVCDFVERVFLRKDLNGFGGDTNFVGNHYAMAAYSKLRSSQAALYAWRVSNSKSPEERQRMIHEADFAFRQSFAMCPTNPDAVFRYVNLILQTSRPDEALVIARAAATLKPSEVEFKRLVREIDRINKSGTK